MTLALRQIRFTPLRVDGIGPPNVMTGYYTIQPTAAYDDGQGRVEPLPFQVDIPGAPTTIDLPVTPGDLAWAWKVSGNFPDSRGDYVTVEYVAVPAGTYSTVLDYEDLIRLDPSTLGPVTAPVSSAIELRLEAVETAIADGSITGGAPAGSGTAGRYTVSDLFDVTTIGVELGTAIDQASARTAIGAGTASTADDVGLGNVDDTADADKPVSDAVATELALLAPLVDAHLTGDVTVPTAVDPFQPVTKAQLDAVALPDLTPYAPLSSPEFTDDPTAPTPAPGDDSNSLATTEWVRANVGTYDNACPNSIFRLLWTGSSPVRPSTRTDIFFDWEGPIPHPNGGVVVTSPATNGMYEGDRRSVTAF